MHISIDKQAQFTIRKSISFLGGTSTHSRLTSGLEKEYLLEKYNVLNASIKDASLKHNLEVK